MFLFHIFEKVTDRVRANVALTFVLYTVLNYGHYRRARKENKKITYLCRIIFEIYSVHIQCVRVI